MPRAEIPDGLGEYQKGETSMKTRQREAARQTHTVKTCDLANSLRMAGSKADTLKVALENVLHVGLPEKGWTRVVLESSIRRLKHIQDELTAEANMLDKWGES